MLTVGDAEENDWAFSLALSYGAPFDGVDFWIGLNDVAQEGDWVWEDGSDVVFSVWADGEPDDAGNEDCAHFRTSELAGWRDLECSLESGYVCESN